MNNIYVIVGTHVHIWHYGQKKIEKNLLWKMNIHTHTPYTIHIIFTQFPTATTRNCGRFTFHTYILITTFNRTDSSASDSFKKNLIQVSISCGPRLWCVHFWRAECWCPSLQEWRKKYDAFSSNYRHFSPFTSSLRSLILRSQPPHSFIWNFWFHCNAMALIHNKIFVLKLAHSESHMDAWLYLYDSHFS